MAEEDATRRGPRLRVLVVCAVNGHGGPIQTMITLMTALRRDVHFTLATQLRRPGEESPIEAAADVSTDIPRPIGARVMSAQFQLLRTFWPRRNDIDVVHANGLTEAVLVLPLAVCARLPVVVWVHNWERPRPFSLSAPIVRLVGRRWSWMAVSDLASGLVPWASSMIVSNPISDDVVPKERSSSDVFRVAYLAGSDRPSKGFDLVPSIIRGVESDRVRFILYTSSPFTTDDDRCTEAWRALSDELSDRVSIRERVERVSEAFAETDLVLAPSRHESFNRVIAESVVNGLPFVASDISPHRSLTERTGAGLLFPIERPETASTHIERIANEPEMWQRMSSSALSARSEFAVDTIGLAVMSAWSSAAKTSSLRWRTWRRTRSGAASAAGPLRAYVINLDSRPEKWASAERECRSHGLEVQRYSASTPSDGAQILPESNLVGGELGLAATFVRFLGEAATTDDDWVLLFEDDIRFRRRFSQERLRFELDSLPETVGLSRFGFLDGSEWRRDLSLPRNLKRRLRLRKRWKRLIGRSDNGLRFRGGAHAMAVRPAVAGEIAALFRGISTPLDHEVFRWERERPDLVSPLPSNLATQRLFASDIAESRRAREGRSYEE